MSTIASIILVTHCCEHDIALVRILNEMMENEKDRICGKTMMPFKQVEPLLPENSLFDRDVFVAAMKNFDPEDFRAIVRRVPWQNPEFLTVFHKSEADDVWQHMDGLCLDEFEQEPAMIFNPGTGEKYDEDIVDFKAQELRDLKQVGAWLFNPWTGEVRDSFEVLEDPFGRLIDPPLQPGDTLPSAIDYGVRLTTMDDHEIQVGVVVGLNEAMYDGFLNVHDIPPEMSQGEAVEFILSIPNPDRKPVKIFPEPHWWNDFIKR